MAEVLPQLPNHHRHASSVASVSQGTSLRHPPAFHMIPNPDFSFPALPPAAASQSPVLPPAAALHPSPRPISMPLGSDVASHTTTAHRRAASTLPSFAFNATDASGLADDASPPSPSTPEEPDPLPTTPSRRGHRRGGSEFVGGDSRYGVGTVVSSSPTKTTAMPLPLPPSGPPPSRRGHAHRRSAAISSHDVSTFMHADVLPRLSSSLPSTPLEHPAHQLAFPDSTSSDPPLDPVLPDPFGPALEDAAARPPSRPRVGFSDNVEYIPRPLSTISSETESSLSTMRGHSVNNSISSVLSLGTPSPPPRHHRGTSLSTTFEDEPRSKSRSSIEISRRIEKEGEWLKSGPSDPNLRRPATEPAAALPAQARGDRGSTGRSIGSCNLHTKRQSLSHALGMDRRRSEPLLSLKLEEPARQSAISLPGQPGDPEPAPCTHDSCAVERLASARKLRDWAMSKLSKRSRKTAASGTPVTARPRTADDPFVPGRVPMMTMETPQPAPQAETNLDAVLGNPSPGETPRQGTPPSTRLEVSTPTPNYHAGVHSWDSDELSPILDLDAALGPFKTPPLLGPHRHRRELHSSRLNRDFTGLGGHYHRRAESAPILAAFDGPRHKSMDDVFEEEEDESTANGRLARFSRLSAPQDVEAGVGIQVVDSDRAGSASTMDWGLDDGLRIRRGLRESAAVDHDSSRLHTPTAERQAPSIIEETIVEESSPVDAVEIVESYEEPRASSLTKSSDSSDTPTVLTSQNDTLAPPSFVSPETNQPSAFSTPDFERRQGSFDNASRRGTSASSTTDNRTMSSYATGETGLERRGSVDDVPSLTSSRSTMMSTVHAHASPRDFSGRVRTPSVASSAHDPTVAGQLRRKRASIASLSQLVGGPFGAKSKGGDGLRPQTAIDQSSKAAKKKEHRLNKLLFWKRKNMNGPSPSD